jgi:hypothetical protein
VKHLWPLKLSNSTLVASRPAFIATLIFIMSCNAVSLNRHSVSLLSGRVLSTHQSTLKWKNPPSSKRLTYGHAKLSISLTRCLITPSYRSQQRYTIQSRRAEDDRYLARCEKLTDLVLGLDLVSTRTPNTFVLSSSTTISRFPLLRLLLTCCYTLSVLCCVFH